MSDAQDDFLKALRYQVQAEVVRHYFRERLILEEEIEEYHEQLEEYRQLEIKTGELRDQLVCLLIGPENLFIFCKLLGFSSPPLKHLGLGEAALAAPACPLGLTPSGFTKKSQYIDLVIKTYERLADQVAEIRKAVKELRTLAEEINRDINKFHRNFDLMAIINFFRNLDSATQIRQEILGANFSAAEIAALEKNMAFQKLDPEVDRVVDWPELPLPKEVRNLTADFLGQLFKQDRSAIIPVLKK